MRQLDIWSRCATAVATAEEPAAPADAATHLERYLTVRARRPVRLVVTDNRSTFLSFKEAHGVLRVRAHRLFLGAAPEIHEALAAYVAEDDRTAGRILDRFIAARSAELPRPPVAVQPLGRFHDLSAIFSRLNQRFFHGACRARISWGTAGPRRYRRSIQLGCYVADDRLIRIHPCLDQVFVPEQYVAWVVFHEMLHEVFGVAAKRGRRCLHPPEFSALEQTFPDYERCKAWEHTNLPRLLSFGARDRGRTRR